MKKIFLGLFVFVAGIVLASNLIKVKAAATVTLTEGVSIRTDAHAGMKFRAYVSEEVEGATYGMVFAQGAVADIEVGDDGTFNAEVTEIDEENYYYITMVNFPVRAYYQNISARAYIKDAEGNYTYSSATVTRNLYELASASGLDGDFVEKVLTATKFELGAGEFVYDYDFNLTKYNTGSSGNCVNIVTYANRNKVQNRYWLRLYVKLDSASGLYKIVGVDTADGIDNSGEYEEFDYSIGLHGTPTIAEELLAKEFLNDMATSEDLTQYYLSFTGLGTSNCNVKVHTNSYMLLSNVVLFEEGTKLPVASLEHYEFNGWYDNNLYTGEAVSVQGSARTLYAKYTPVEYSISYTLNGGTCSASLVESYNVESSEIVLPTAEQMTITNGLFAGWYDNADFDGDAITTVDVANGGNITLYAKWQMLVSTDVTFEMNGGERAVDYEFIIKEFRNTDWSGAHTNLSTSTSTITKNAARVFVKYNETLGLYESISALAAGSSYPDTLPDGTTHILGAYPDNDSFTPSDPSSTEAILEIVALVLAGEKVYFDFGTVPTSGNTLTWSRTAYAYTSIDLIDSNVVSYKEDVAELPKLQKTGYTFVGWFNDNDEKVESIKVATEDVELTLYAKFDAINYTISWNLNGGTCSVELPLSYNIESETIILPTVSQMTLEDAEFVGWENAAGEIVTEISKGSVGNVELTASWVLEQANPLEISDADATGLNAVYSDKSAAATILVNTAITVASKYVLSNANLNEGYAEVEYVYGVNLFSDIADALNAAEANDVIYVFAGTYSTALTISKANITLAGPYYDVKGSANRSDEANFTGSVNIAAAGVVVNGFKFTESANVKISANNVVFANSYVSPSSTVGSAGSNRKGILVSGVSTKLTAVSILNNYLDTPGTAFKITTESIVMDNVENCVISGNYITNSKTTAAGGTNDYPGSSAMIRLYSVSGTLNINNNEFAWATYGYAFEIANNANTCTEINIKENVFNNNGLYADTAGINIRKGKTTTVTNIIGNKFYNVSGSTILATADEGSTINVKYNIFGEGTSYKTGGVGSANLSFSNNYYASSTQTTATSDFDTYTHDAAGLVLYETDYAAYKAK